MIARGLPNYIRSDNGPEFTGAAVRDWLGHIGARAFFIEPSSPRENGYCDRTAPSVSGRLHRPLWCRDRLMRPSLSEGGHQSAKAPVGGVRTRLHLHPTRSVAGAPHLQSCGGDVSRPDRGNRGHTRYAADGASPVFRGDVLWGARLTSEGYWVMPCEPAWLRCGKEIAGRGRCTWNARFRPE